MTNSEMPIYPPSVTCNKNGIYSSYDTNGGSIGLTKREYYAGLALQGLLSNYAKVERRNYEEAVQHAIAYADELLRQLEK